VIREKHENTVERESVAQMTSKLRHSTAELCRFVQLDNKYSATKRQPDAVLCGAAQRQFALVSRLRAALGKAQPGFDRRISSDADQ